MLRKALSSSTAMEHGTCEQRVCVTMEDPKDVMCIDVWLSVLGLVSVLCWCWYKVRLFFFLFSLSHSHARSEHNNSCSCIIIITMSYEDTHDIDAQTHTHGEERVKKKFIRVPHVLHENHIRTIQWLSLNFVVEFHKQSIRVCCGNFVNCRYGGVDEWLGWLAETACVGVKWV